MRRSEPAGFSPSSARQMMPTPRKPVPSRRRPAQPCGVSLIAVPENAAAPRATIANVRSPALLPRDSRSRPIKKPSSAASPIRAASVSSSDSRPSSKVPTAHQTSPARGSIRVTVEGTCRRGSTVGCESPEEGERKVRDRSSIRPLLGAVVVATLLARLARLPPACTWTGTPGPDVKHGTPGDDVLCGMVTTSSTAVGERSLARQVGRRLPDGRGTATTSSTASRAGTLIIGRGGDSRMHGGRKYRRGTGASGATWCAGVRAATSPSTAAPPAPDPCSVATGTTPASPSDSSGNDAVFGGAGVDPPWSDPTATLANAEIFGPCFAE